MAFELKSIVPWGRSYDEYQRMFDLTEQDLAGRTLGCADGPAGFNAEATQKGYRVVSADPLYAFDAASILQRIEETYDEVLAQCRANADNYVWTTIRSVEEMGRIRMEAMRRFLEDYDSGHNDGRYVAAELPELPFDEEAFDLCLCSHFLFLYESHLSYDFHVSAIGEMLRVAPEARIFPLLTMDSKPSEYAARIIAEADRHGWTVQRHRVPYEFQRGGHTMLRVTRRGQE